MDGITERIKAAYDIRRYLLIAIPGVRYGHRDKFGESTVTIDTDPAGGIAKVTAAGEAVSTVTANDVAFCAYPVADLEILNIAPHLNDMADKLMAYHQRRLYRFLCPAVPVINMDIRTAN